MAQTLGLVQISYKSNRGQKNCYLPTCKETIEPDSIYLGIPYIRTYGVNRVEDGSYKENVSFASKKYFHQECFLKYAIYMLENREKWQKKRGRKPIALTEEQQKRRKLLYQYIDRDRRRLVTALELNKHKQILTAWNSYKKHANELESQHSYKPGLLRIIGFAEAYTKYVGQPGASIESVAMTDIEDLLLHTIQQNMKQS